MSKYNEFKEAKLNIQRKVAIMRMNMGDIPTDEQMKELGLEDKAVEWLKNHGDIKDIQQHFQCDEHLASLIREVLDDNIEKLDRFTVDRDGYEFFNNFINSSLGASLTEEERKFFADELTKGMLRYGSYEMDVHNRTAGYVTGMEHMRTEFSEQIYGAVKSWYQGDFDKESLTRIADFNTLITAPCRVVYLDNEMAAQSDYFLSDGIFVAKDNNYTEEYLKLRMANIHDYHYDFIQGYVASPQAKDILTTEEGATHLINGKRFNELPLEEQAKIAVNLFARSEPPYVIIENLEKMKQVHSLSDDDVRNIVGKVMENAWTQAISSMNVREKTRFSEELDKSQPPTAYREAYLLANDAQYNGPIEPEAVARDIAISCQYAINTFEKEKTIDAPALETSNTKKHDISL